MKRYIDVYSASSAVGFSSDDLSRIESTYAQAESHWLHSTKQLLSDSKIGSDTVLPTLKRQIDAYFNFLETVADLARSKWTEFDLKLMMSGIIVMFGSIIFQILTILKRNKQLGIFMPRSGASGTFSISTLAYVLLAIRACSFLSNSYICEFDVFGISVGAQYTLTFQDIHSHFFGLDFFVSGGRKSRKFPIGHIWDRDAAIYGHEGEATRGSVYFT